MSVPGGLYYLYNRYKLGLSLSYLRDIEFTEISQAYLSYISPGRFLSLQALAGYKEEKHFKSVKTANTRLNREYKLGGPALTLLLGDIHFFRDSISAEKGWSIFAQGSYYTAENSKLGSYERDRFLREEELSYGFGEGGLALYLPSFFDNHVNYLASYAYHYFGPTRQQRHHEQGNLVRNLDPDVFPGESFIVYSYEYRFPLLWGSPAPLFWGFPFLGSFSLRYLSLAPFYDYGIVKNQARTYQTWAYGLRIGIALNLFHLPLPELSFTISEGRNSETFYSLFFSTSTSALAENKEQSQTNKITKPYRHLPPQIKQSPGYFHNNYLP